ncbi:hypothetical protein PV332_05895 [Streptomyces scabiei]|nr:MULTISPECIES: hypothetical protein [Streptomyces]MDX2532811.1 hypothetical protein [Streptomyces scabiei]MDX2575020.1 hypothetical protein [Streptomyces scabiei]MDX2650940.1 hypothetical protein [Streptomyces scabiei]MDX2719718.1 hypothetical protein [Streptomyces scabiei]MDX2795133.1 hypothetical protein [Streptomyces scabiei]
MSLRHADITIAEKRASVVPRQNDNRGRAKANCTPLTLAAVRWCPRP